MTKIIKNLFSNKKYYVLDDSKNVIIANRRKSIDFFEDDKNRLVARDKMKSGIVSTIFFNEDIEPRKEKVSPTLFETMIFTGPLDGYTEKYSSYDDAINGHKRAIAVLKNSSK